MVFVWMLKGPFGMQMWAIAIVSGSVKGERSSKQSTWTEAALPACWVVIKARRFLYWPIGGVGQRAWAMTEDRVRF